MKAKESLAPSQAEDKKLSESAMIAQLEEWIGRQ